MALPRRLAVRVFPLSSLPQPLGLVLLVCVAALPLACGEERRRDPAAPATERPNIVVILTDDHGYADLGAQGVLPDLRTPHLDALAAGGARMSAGYVTAPQCVPSRAGLLTGRFQARFGIEANESSVQPLAAEQTVAERLREAGYATGMVGKWHLGPGTKIDQHGFEDIYLLQGDSWNNYDLDGNTVEGRSRKSDGYHIETCTRAARVFVERHHEEPFFLLLSYRAPHEPLDAPPEALARIPGEMPEARRQALAMLALVDDGVGGLLETLAAFGLEQRTLVIACGDNGAPVVPVDAAGAIVGAGVTASMWNGSRNDPFSGGKGMLSEGGIRVPWVMQWPGVIPPGQVYEHPVSTLDVAATAVALAGLPADAAFDGVDLVPFLTGERVGAPHAALAWRWNAQAALREGDWKYLRAGQRQYLFDLASDPREQHDLSADEPYIAAAMRTRLGAFCDQLQPPGFDANALASRWDDFYEFYLGSGSTVEGVTSSAGDATDAGTAQAKTRAVAPAAKPASAQSNAAVAPTAGAGSHAPSPAAAPAAKPAALQGWLARNSTVTVVDGALRVTPPAPPEPPAREPPFLARMSLELPASCAVRVRMRCATGGSAGVSWRTSGQADFVGEQRVAFELAASADWQEHRVSLPASDTVIHLRLLLPAAPVDVAEIECTDASGRSLQRWRF